MSEHKDSIEVIDEAGIIGISSVSGAQMTDKRQCEYFTVEYLYYLIKSFKDMKLTGVYITVEEGKVLLIGGKKYGLILAPRIK
jgi:hypothetical protein